jgi:uncharacterized protein YaaN involved in tellurite resistance
MSVKGDQVSTNQPSFQIQFPVAPNAQPQLVVPPQPASPGDQYLKQVAQSSDARTALVCKDLLSPQGRQQAEEWAQQLYPQMLANTQVFMSFGQDAIAEMNSLIDSLLKEVEPVDIPELTAMMRQLNDEMRNIRKKYDVSDDRVRERLEHWTGGIGRFFGHARSLIEALMEDAMSLEQQLDRVTGQLGGKEQQIVRNVHIYDSLYETNEAEIQKLISAIAVMELIRELAASDAAAIVVDAADQADHEKSERKRMLAEFANNMDTKIAEYKNRLFVGWTTSPQVTNMRTLDVGLAQRLDLLINLTIPTMKGTILQWRMLIQAEQGVQMEQVVAGAANEWLTAYTAAGAQAVPLIAQGVQTPTLTPQSITAMAAAIEQQANGIINAYNDGKVKRAEADNAIVEAQKVIADSTNRVSDAIVNKYVEETQATTAASPTPALPLATT